MFLWGVMIISHKHKFIFIHCRKTAGSSITTSLARYLGNDDLQSSAIIDGARQKIYPPRRVIKEALLSMPPDILLSVLMCRRSFWRAVSKSIKIRYSRSFGGQTSHPTALAIASAFPTEWESYFKFCVVRNPWQKTLSDYYWVTKKFLRKKQLSTSPPSFEEYVQALANGQDLEGIVPKGHRNWDMYTINDKITVDYIIRFEDLMNGLTEALAQTSVDWDGWMPHMKKGVNPSSREYRPFYSEGLAGIVHKLYEKEINEFNYEF